jgi:hypothetical protein
MAFNRTLFLLKSFNDIILLNNNLANITKNESSPYISEENQNEGYLFLLLFDLLIFGSLTYITYTSSKKLEKENLSPEDFRLNFLKWLVIANGLRTLSLIFILIIGNPNGNNGISWVNSILHIGPAFVFVSSYKYLATFFSYIYYTSIDYTNHLLTPALTIVINGGYALLGLVGLITLLARAYKVFFYISELLMALLYLVLGAVIIYFGKKLSELIKSKSKSNFDANEGDKNLGFMSFSIGGLFVLKGVSGVLGGVGAYDPPNHNIYDFFWFLILEVLPTLIFIYIAKKKDVNNNPETPRSTINFYNEFELGSQRNTSYRPPFEKE